MDATNVGVRRVHPYLWSLSSPQQPLETEDSPTVSSCPTIYIATRVPGNAHVVDDIEGQGFAADLIAASSSCGKLTTKLTPRIE